MGAVRQQQQQQPTSSLPGALSSSSSSSSSSFQGLGALKSVLSLAARVSTGGFGLMPGVRFKTKLALTLRHCRGQLLTLKLVIYTLTSFCGDRLQIVETAARSILPDGLR